MYFTSSYRGQSSSKGSRKLSDCIEKKKDKSPCPEEPSIGRKGTENIHLIKSEEYFCENTKEITSRKTVKVQESKGKKKESSSRGKILLRDSELKKSDKQIEKISKLPPIPPILSSKGIPSKKSKPSNPTRKHKKSEDSIHNTSKQSQNNQSASYTLTTSLSQRILQNIDVIHELTKKYQESIQQIQARKSYQCLALISKYESTKSKITFPISKITIQLFKQTLLLYDQLLLSNSIGYCCDIMYFLLQIPHGLLDYDTYFWTRITFVLLAKLRSNQSSTLHTKNLVSYCRVNFCLQLTNLLQQHKVEVQIYEILNLIQKKLLNPEKRQKQIQQNLIIIKSIALMLIECNGLDEVQLCLVNEKEQGQFDRQFFRIWRQQKLYPLLPSISQLYQFTICIDIDNTLLWMEKGKPQLRPYSLELLQGFSKQVQIILFSMLDGEQLDQMSRVLLPQRQIPESNLLPNFSLPSSLIPICKLFNRESSSIILLSSISYPNGFAVSPWRGSDYDNQLLTIAAKIQQRITPLFI